MLVTFIQGIIFSYLKLKLLEPILTFLHLSVNSSSSTSLSLMSNGLSASFEPLLQENRPTKFEKNGLQKPKST